MPRARIVRTSCDHEEYGRPAASSVLDQTYRDFGQGITDDGPVDRTTTIATFAREDRQNKTLAFCLYKYFPHGGLERDMLHIALACQSRGYTVKVYAASWRGEAQNRWSFTFIDPA